MTLQVTVGSAHRPGTMMTTMLTVWLTCGDDPLEQEVKVYMHAYRHSIWELRS